MAINPISLVSAPLQVPAVDTSWLANLYTNYQGSKLNQAKLGEAERRQGALAELGKLDPKDPNFAQQAAALAFRLGDLGAGATLINNAAELKLKQDEAAREAAIGKRFSQPGAAPAVAPAVAPQTTPAQPAITTNAPLFTRTPEQQQSTPPGGTVAPDIPARTSEAPSPAAQANPVVFAKTQLGRGEIPDRAALQDYMRTGGANLDPATLAWCAAFVNASLGHAGIKGTGSNMARSFLNFGSPTQNPNPGDIAVFQRGGPNAATGHVGFYQGRDANGNILVLGGNQGDRVSVAPFPESQLLGFRKVMPGDSGTAGPVGSTAPGTVAADLRGRGPASYGQGGGAMAAAMPQTPLARTTVAALDPSFTPQTSMTDAGPQLPVGVSPAAPAAQGVAGPPILPSPTPLVPPNLSLAALGSPPAGGVGTIGGPPSAANAPSVQMAQAGPYQLPWNFTQPQAPPALPVRPPVQQAPVAAPVQQPVQARGAPSGAPLAHVSDADLIAASSSKRWGEMARAEIARRSAVAADANKTSPEYNNFLADKRSGAFPANGTFIEWQQAGRADTTHKRNYDAIVAERAAQGLPPPPGGYERYLEKMKPGTTVNVGGEKIDRAETAFVDRMEKIADAGGLATRNKSLVGALEAMNVTTGFTAAALAKAGEFGLNLPGTDKVQAFNSLIDFMVPAQPRTPGPQAAMETAMLRNSLPKLINQEGGTKIIMSIMRASADIEERMGDIAERYMTSEKDENGKRIYTAAQANKDMKAVREESRDLVATAVRLAAGKSAPGAENAPAGGAGGKWTYPEGTSDADKAAADKILQDAMRKR